MADNFKDLTKALVEQNKSQEETTDAVNKLNQTMADHFAYLKRKEKSEEEDRREANKAKRQAQSTPTNKNKPNNAMKLLGVAGLMTALSGIAGTIGTVAGIATAFVLASEGLGVYAKDLKAFNKATKAFFTPLTKTTEQMGKLKNGLLRSLGIIDDAAKGTEGPPGTKKATLAQLANRRFDRFKLKLLNSLGIGPDGKAIQIRMPKGQFGAKSPFGLKLEKALSKFDELFSKLRNFGNAIAGYFSTSGGGPAGQGGTPSKGGSLLAKLASFKPLRIVGRILRPVAILFSVFDGMRNASKEMDDKDAYIEKYLGGAVGGFISGFIGSFFGEFFNLFTAIPLFIVKKIVPNDWLIEGEDGKVRFDENKNILTKLLAGFEILDFNRLLRDLVQRPFDVLAESLTFLTGLLGFGDEENQTKAKARWDEWWNKTTWGQKGFDILRVMTDIVFSPINSIMREIETAFFGADPEREKVGFVERVTKWTDQFFTWLGSFLPDIKKITDDITQAVVSKLPKWLRESLGFAETPEDIAKNVEFNNIPIDPGLKKAAMSKLLSDISSFDNNKDGKITFAEIASKTDGKSAIDKLLQLDSLRGGDLTGNEAMRQMRGDGLAIGTIDNSTSAPTIISQNLATTLGAEDPKEIKEVKKRGFAPLR